MVCGCKKSHMEIFHQNDKKKKCVIFPAESFLSGIFERTILSELNFLIFLLTYPVLYKTNRDFVFEVIYLCVY